MLATWEVKKNKKSPCLRNTSTTSSYQVSYPASQQGGSGVNTWVRIVRNMFVDKVITVKMYAISTGNIYWEKEPCSDETETVNKFLFVCERVSKSLTDGF